MLTCPSCGQENPQGFRFCGACAASLETERPPAREERKVVTVLFADLVGFTARAERMDPEEVRSLLQPYHAHLRRELERHGGTVEKFIGDAVMAVFGAQLAHEDDPERAVRAALAIREWASEGNELEVRIAVATVGALEVRAHALNTIGTARAQLGDLAGISDLESSLELARSIDSGPSVLRAYNNLTVAVETAGDLQRTYELGEEAIRDAERLGGHVAAMVIRANQSHVLHELGRWDEALRVAEEVRFRR